MACRNRRFEKHPPGQSDKTIAAARIVKAGEVIEITLIVFLEYLFHVVIGWYFV